MRFEHPTLLAIVVLLTMVGNPNPAEASPYDTEVLIQPHAESTSFSWQEALRALPPGAYPADELPSIVAGPLHGELVDEDSTGELRYTPDSSFWELGTDSFVARVASLDPDAYVTVTLQASDFREVLHVKQSFEGAVENLSGNATVTSEAALAGSMGLRAIVEDGLDEDAVYAFSHDEVMPPGAGGSTEELKLRPPPDPPLPWGIPEAETVVVYSLDRETDDPAAEIVLAPVGSGWQISARLYNGASIATTPLVELGGVESKLRLDWWNAWGPRSGGLRLWVDGELAGSLASNTPWDAGEARRRVGAMLEPKAVNGIMIDVDDVRSSWAEFARAAFRPILRDGFEGGLEAWNTMAAPYIKTTPAAAMIGPEGLQIDVVYGFDGTLLDSSPAAETDVGVRMRLSTDGLSVPMDGSLELLALSGLDIGTGSDEARLVLKNTFAGLGLFAQARSSTGWLSTPMATLAPGGAHTVELRWRAADPGDENGSARLWVDGRPGTRLDGLKNAGAAIESMRLGAWNVSAGARGALYVDAFESWSFVQ